MKATGIIRRIDDLGRVFIPKEIRRGMRVHEGDALEIYRDGDMVCFKKYSSVVENLTDIKKYLNALYKVINKFMIVTDTDGVVATVGDENIRNMQDKRVSSNIERISKAIQNVCVVDGESVKAKLVYPIVSEGDTIGTICLFGKSGDEEVSEVELNLIKTAALYFGIAE